MRPIPARVLLTAVCIAALATGVLTSRVIFFVVALGAGVLLGTSLSTSRRPLTQALQRFHNQAVEVQFWGVPPSGLPGGPLVLTSVNALGAGVHLFFDAPGGGHLHLKVAQPSDPGIASASVTIGSARYVQWNGTRVQRGSGAPAVTIALSQAT
jgi:hypothetical protein